MMLIRIALILIFTSVIIVFELSAQSDTVNSLGAKEAPLNYVTSWYAGNGAQMELALHPELVKRRVVSDTSVSSVSYSWMINAAATCMGCIQNVKEGRIDITILDETDSIASAKVLSNDFFDYLHLVKSKGYWKILNVVWDYYDCNSGDSTKLVTILENYLEYWKTGEVEQMERLLHPEYSGGLALSHNEIHRVNKAQLLSLTPNNTDYSRGSDYKVEILDIYMNTASVKISLNDSVEYLHLSYQNDKWYIINALRNFNFSSVDK